MEPLTHRRFGSECFAVLVLPIHAYYDVSLHGRWSVPGLHVKVQFDEAASIQILVLGVQVLPIAL